MTMPSKDRLDNDFVTLDGLFQCALAAAARYGRHSLIRSFFDTVERRTFSSRYIRFPRSLFLDLKSQYLIEVGDTRGAVRLLRERLHHAFLDVGRLLLSVRILCRLLLKLRRTQEALRHYDWALSRYVKAVRRGDMTADPEIIDCLHGARSADANWTTKYRRRAWVVTALERCSQYWSFSHSASMKSSENLDRWIESLFQHRTRRSRG